MALRMSAAAPRAQSLVGSKTPFDEKGWCLHWCARDVYADFGSYRWGGNGRAWAINFWDAAVRWGRVVKTSDPGAVPAGAMTFGKGAGKYGHVWISDGKAGAYTTDYPRTRRIGHAPVRDMLRWLGGGQQLGYILVTGSGVDYRDTGRTPPMVPTVTVWDTLSWNVAHEKWFTEWDDRQAAIGAAMRGDASMNGLQEVYTEEQVADIMRALGGDFSRVGTGGPGLEWVFDHTRWDQVGYEVHRVGPQGRGLFIAEQRRKATGKIVVFGNLHAPALRPDYRATFGKRIEPLLREVDVLVGDFNTGKNNLAPRANIRRAGFRDMREQASVKNGGMSEFPGKGKWLADQYSKPDKVKIVYGELHQTAPRLSDHKELTTRMEAR